MSKDRVLIVDDEEHILELIKFNLEQNGYQVMTKETGEECLAFLDQESVDILVLDLMLPGIDGIEVCKQIRSKPNLKTLPIIMLTAKGEETDRILGLEFGADDYMSKPFSVRELIARMKAVLRRSGSQQQQLTGPLQVGDLILDVESHELRLNGEVIKLTIKEHELLKTLLENRGKVLSRNFLLDKIWGYAYYGDTRTVDVHIRQLRKKIKEDENRPYIETIRGAGYKIK
ncbi:response regulator transcription factor [Serpentinicella sp. ANB-PHB4]|uniref:response regulator transcription factor n=1 Tax=Serpentinicella sp. ANB-PHB4 TaxID=3074076 RepID=UPI002859E394|nr:response regulator transcription factor [Serpentinicella sp. ANB-PHB4]MDR5658834.1 response regulator transcription factor [Serpentinicella sp. ANB-PHB4]